MGRWLFPTQWGSTADCGGDRARRRRGWSLLASAVQGWSPPPTGGSFFSGRLLDRDYAPDAGQAPGGDRDPDRKQDHDRGDDDRQRVRQPLRVAQAEVRQVATRSRGQEHDEDRSPDRPQPVLAVEGRGLAADQPEQPPRREAVEDQAADDRARGDADPD